MAIDIGVFHNGQYLAEEITDFTLISRIIECVDYDASGVVNIADAINWLKVLVKTQPPATHHLDG